MLTSLLTKSSNLMDARGISNPVGARGARSNQGIHLSFFPRVRLYCSESEIDINPDGFIENPM